MNEWESESRVSRMAETTLLMMAATKINRYSQDVTKHIDIVTDIGSF